MTFHSLHAQFSTISKSETSDSIFIVIWRCMKIFGAGGCILSVLWNILHLDQCTVPDRCCTHTLCSSCHVQPVQQDQLSFLRKHFKMQHCWQGLILVNSLICSGENRQVCILTTTQHVDSGMEMPLGIVSVL